LRECDNRLEGSKWTIEKTADTEDLHSHASRNIIWVITEKCKPEVRGRDLEDLNTDGLIGGGRGDHRIQKNTKIGE
jgi:hypothetical protein